MTTATMEKAMVLALMTDWVADELATDKNDQWGYFDDYEFQFEKDDFLYIYVKRDLAFTFLSELQTIIEINRVYFDDRTCTIVTENDLKINVGYLLSKR